MDAVSPADAALAPEDLGIGRLFWSVRDAVVVGDTATGNVVHWSPSAERLFGYSPDEVVGRPLEILVPNRLRDHHRVGIRRYAATGRGPLVDAGSPVEVVAVRKDGLEIPVELSLSPVDLPGLPSRYVIAIVRDVSERRRAEAERLRRARAEAASRAAEGEQRRAAFLAEAGAVLAASLDYEATLAQVARLAVPALADWCLVHLADDDGALLPVAIYHADPGRVDAAWGAAGRPPGASDAPVGPTEAALRGRQGLAASIADEGLAAVGRYLDHRRPLPTAAMPSAMTVPVSARGRVLGTITLVAAESGRAYDEHDLALAQALADRAGLAVDNARLHARVRAADAYHRALLDGALDGVVVTDEDGSFVDANPAAEALVGYPLAELQALGPVGGGLVAAGESWHGEAWERLREDGCWRGEVALRHRDGQEVTVEASVTAVHLEDRRVYVAVWRDISERNRLDELRRDVLRMVAHDLRTPLTAVQLGVQLLQREELYRAETVEAMATQADRMRRLLADLADVVRLEAGHLDLRREPVDLAELARREAAAIQVQSPAHAVAVQAPDGPIVGEWDADRLGQVLQNLLGNAVKHTPEGGTVAVRVEGAGGEGRLTVRDEGPGIGAEHLPRLFERFYRAGTGGDGGLGLGLGLHITRMIVEAHGGTIRAESEEGLGSTFTVRLPACPPKGLGTGGAEALRLLARSSTHRSPSDTATGSLGSD